MDETRSKQLTRLLHTLQELDRRCGSDASDEDMAAAKQAAREFYNSIRNHCTSGHTVVIHTKSGLARREEVRSVGKLDIDNMITTYSPNWDEPVCVTPLNLVDGDFVEVML